MKESISVFGLGDDFKNNRDLISDRYELIGAYDRDAKKTTEANIAFCDISSFSVSFDIWLGFSQKPLAA